MTREWIRGLAIAILIMMPILGFFSYVFGENPFSMLILLFGIAIILFILSSFFEPEKKEWVCQQCNMTLVRSQIKFGLCPNCGVKVKGFRGLRPSSYI